jgi:hypothetical protein
MHLTIMAVELAIIHILVEWIDLCSNHFTSNSTPGPVPAVQKMRKINLSICIEISTLVCGRTWVGICMM